MVVKNIPKYKEYREKCLPLAREFATLDEKIKNKYEDKDSSYSFGWSFGKEKFSGKFGNFFKLNIDVSKGSFYANPQYDEPTNDKELIKKYP